MTMEAAAQTSGDITGWYGAVQLLLQPEDFLVCAGGRLFKRTNFQRWGNRRLPAMPLCVFVWGYYGNLTQTVGTLNRAQFADRPQTNVLVLGDGSVGHISICFGYSLRLGCVALCFLRQYGNQA